MSTEYIRAVSIRKGQVFLTSKSNNDDIPYHAWHCESLSKVYREEGQLGLDREIMRMLCEYAVLKGSHRSIARYRFALEALESKKVCQLTARKLKAAFELLPPLDQAHPFTAKSREAEAFRQTERKLLDRKYTVMAKMCQRYQEE